MTYSKKKKATNHANCVSLITEERAREIVDKRDREANALKASPVYAPYINSLGDRMQRALNEMLANEEKYNIKNNDNDNKSNI